jgi:predicted alpha/beta-fold hydrolase
MHLEPFFAPRWLRNPHVQSLGAALPLHAPLAHTPAGATSERLELAVAPGEAIVARAWWHPGRPRATAIVVHGVGGTSESRYVVRAARALFRAGMHVVRVSLRGVGDGVRHARCLYHAGMTEDPKRVVEALSRDPRVASLGVLGFSLGGNVSLKMAGEMGADAPSKLAAVATVSAPLDLVAVSRVIEQKRRLPYRAWVMKGLVGQAVDLARAQPEHVKYHPKALWRARTIRDYDAIVVVPTHGFRDPTDYYERTSAGPHLANVRVPTLLVHADDDPMVPGDTVKPFLRDLPSTIEVAWSDSGGHVGWYAGLDEERWVETWAMTNVRRFFERRLPSA